MATRFKIKKIIKDNPLQTAAVTIASANLGTNIARHKSGREYQEKQLKAMQDLTESLGKVDKSLNKENSKPKFRLKPFSEVGSSAITGAKVGAAVGTALGGIAPRTLPKFVPGHDKYNALRDGDRKEGGNTQKLILIGSSILVGAALGAVVGGIKDIAKSINRNNTVDARSMSEIKSIIEKHGYKEGRDFTMDPKAANLMKTKVCLVISKDASEYRVLINMIDDRKLKTISDRIQGDLKKDSSNQIRNNQASNKYNEVSVTSVRGKDNASQAASIALEFLKAGYKVYLVEVG